MISRTKNGKSCGPSRGRSRSGVVRLSDCNDDVANHIVSSYLSKEALSENELIFAGAGLFNVSPEDAE